mmetsp:Transcript_4906/g.11615  ORF Transcript_4906/g.11615 Transcript_4906/m.11615 type:complete len:231 (+) Transcript_4906:750-1442(+)
MSRDLREGNFSLTQKVVLFAHVLIVDLEHQLVIFVEVWDHNVLIPFRISLIVDNPGCVLSLARPLDVALAVRIGTAAAHEVVSVSQIPSRYDVDLQLVHTLEVRRQSIAHLELPFGHCHFDRDDRFLVGLLLAGALQWELEALGSILLKLLPAYRCEAKRIVLSDHIVIQNLEEKLVTIMHVIDLVFVIPDWVPVVLHDLRLEAGLALALHRHDAIGVRRSPTRSPICIA